MGINPQIRCLAVQHYVRGLGSCRYGRMVLLTARSARLLVFAVFGLTGCNGHSASAPSPQPANLRGIEVLYKSVTPIAGF